MARALNMHELEATGCVRWFSPQELEAVRMESELIYRRVIEDPRRHRKSSRVSCYTRFEPRFFGDKR